MTALYESMRLIRRVEEQLAELCNGPLKGVPLHLSLGQEAVGVGVAASRRDGDVMLSTHRGTGHCLAWGADPVRLVAEAIGRRGGYARGLAGHMHVMDPDAGILGTNGIVGGGLPIAVGAALGLQRQGGGAIAVAFMGDGAANTGACHEAMNLAAAWSAPVLFVCENNGLAEMTYSGPQTGGDLSVRAAAYGMRAVQTDATDVVAVRDVADELTQAVRSGAGPAFLEATTFRATGHYAGDAQLYRDPEDAEQTERRDPLLALRAAPDADSGALDAIDAAVDRRVEAIFTEVLAMEPPTAQDLFDLGRPR